MVLRIIFGIAVIASGVYCIMFPALGATTVCWMIAGFMLAAGILGVAFYIESKNKEIIAKKNGLYYVGAGIGCLIFSVVAIILAIKAMSSLEGEAILFKVVSILFGLVFVAKGAFDTYAGNLARKVAAPGWLGIMLMGILIIAFGIMCIVNSFYSIVAIGTMIGMNMMIFGTSLLMGQAKL